jgi:probable HAF family extracellular repeat protein
MRIQTLAGVRALRRAIPATLLCLAFGTPLLADDYHYTKIDAPGSVSTIARGINARGEIVGTYIDADGNAHGFLLRKGEFTTIDTAVSNDTQGARAINARGDIIGNYVGADNVLRGYLLSDGLIVPIDYPAASATLVAGVNNAGDITGLFEDQAGKERGFLFKDGVFHKIWVPDSISTQVYGAQDNGRVLVGQALMRSGFHGFIRHEPGQYERFHFPGGFGCTAARSINQRGDIVGGFAFAADECGGDTLHGFLLRDGKFTQIDVPGSIVTQPLGINDDGVIVGRFAWPGGKTYGFKAKPID